jgi:hypothetical protein
MAISDLSAIQTSAEPGAMPGHADWISVFGANVLDYEQMGDFPPGFWGLSPICLVEMNWQTVPHAPE